MKRKVIQIAKSTVMISIPSKWAKKYNLTKGDEVEIKEKGSQLVIDIDKTEVIRVISLDVIALDDRILRHLLSGVHKSGYTEINIKYSSKEQLTTINDLLKNLYTGFVVMDQKQNKITLKKVSIEVEDEFNNSFRRSFLVLISLSESVLDYIKKSQFNSISELVNLEKTNNQLTNFCERLLNKGVYDYTRTTFLYVIIWNIEKIADEYKYLCQKLDKNKTKISNNIISAIGETNKLLNEYYNLFFNFKVEKMNDLEIAKKNIENYCNKLLKSSSQIEIVIIFHLLNILSKCNDFNTSILGLNIEVIS